MDKRRQGDQLGSSERSFRDQRLGNDRGMEFGLKLSLPVDESGRHPGLRDARWNRECGKRYQRSWSSDGLGLYYQRFFSRIPLDQTGRHAELGSLGGRSRDSEGKGMNSLGQVAGQPKS